MKNWIKGIGVVGLLLVGCGTETVSAPDNSETTETVVASNDIAYMDSANIEMNKLTIELCGIVIPIRQDHEPSEGCQRTTQVIWGEITEDDIKISSYVGDIEALGKTGGIGGNRPLMRHVVRINTHGCVLDTHRVPVEKQEVVFSEREFYATNADLTVSMSLEPIPTQRARESFIGTAMRTYLGKQRGTVRQSHYQCQPWEQRQAELEEDNAYTFFQ